MNNTANEPLPPPSPRALCEPGEAARIPLLPLLARRVRLQCLRSTAIGLFPEPGLGSLLMAVEPQHKNRADSISLEAARGLRHRVSEGDIFEFALFGSVRDEVRLRAMETLLRGLPRSAPRPGPGVSFGDNWCCVGIEDLAPAGSLDEPAIRAESSRWAAVWRFRIRLVSPLRILQADRKAVSGRARYCRSEADLDDRSLGHALVNSFTSLKFAFGLTSWQIPPLPLRILRKELFLIDPGGNGTGVGKPLGEGLLGELIVEWAQPPTAEQWQHLVLLQYLGVGQARSLGLGRIQLEQVGGEYTKSVPAIAHRGLALCAEERNLALAYAHVRQHADLKAWPELGHESIDPAGEDVAQARPLLEGLSRRLAAGNVSPSALLPLSLPKPDGGTRDLLIPNFVDRVAQRAVLQAVEPALDALFADTSFGFRRGRGREAARDRILLLQRQGYGVVAETDVKRFFDEVAWWRIETRLRCLFGQDPLVDQIMRWMEAERSDGLPRTQGLPQGAALSPILSNLMLDHLDRVLRDTGDQPVRFADDLVVLCKDAARAGAALQTTAITLADAGLRIKLEKTRITDFRQGFRFVGYRFVGGLAVPAAKDAEGPSALTPAIVERLTPPLEPRLAVQDLAGSGEEPGMLLVINRHGANLSLERGQLRLCLGEDSVEHHAFSTLAAILLLGRCRVSSEVLKAAMRAGVPVHFLSASGRWLGSTAGEPDGTALALWQAQYRRGTEPAFALACAKALVGARLHSMAVVLSHRRGSPAVIQALKRSEDEVEAAPDLAVLRGIEGSATARYFAALDELLPFGFAFQGRNRRPPRDPVNALLSFGYTLLQQAAHAVLHAAQLNPRLGLYHQARGTHAALASDFIEPYRFLVERQVLSQINRREIKPHDFTQRGDGACLLAAPARARFVLALHERFQQPLRALHDEQARGLYGHLQSQAESLKRGLASGNTLKVARFR